ncbi:hypothetical protein MMC12_005133 [Toensbergia leucococca]|nr:hypothetical protein [Toensbergia leucococca]
MPLTSRSKVNAAVLPNVGLQLLNDPAWQTAKATYETQTKIKGNDLDEILNTNGPTDIADFILRIQDGTTKGRYAKTVGIANTCTAFLKEREGAIDMLAQAGGAPGCLTWGCIKLALHIVRGYAEEYQKLLRALADICSWLSPVQMDAVTFSNSDQVQGSLVAVRRFVRASTAIWSDLGKELEELKEHLDRQLRVFEASARAEHHRKTNEGQVVVHSALEAAANSARRKEIVYWLGPPDDAPYGNDFHEEDLRNQLKSRHQGTCSWIYQKPEYQRWLGATTAPERLLFITAGPGAGKSVLAASLIQHLQQQQKRHQPGNFLGDHLILHFFFFYGDRNKNSSIAVAKSLLYQLYEYGRRDPAESCDDIELVLEHAAKARAKSSKKLWDLILMYLSRFRSISMILDALDECIDPADAYEGVSKILSQTPVKIILTGRPEEHRLQNTGLSFLRLGIGPQEITEDIKTFLGTKTRGAFSCPSHRQFVIDKILSKAEGMFLWVKLVVLALESINRVSEIEDALSSLPIDLNAAYESTIRRMHSNMKDSPGMQRRCMEALRRLTCSLRPLRTIELFEAMTPDSDEDEILFTKEDLSSACDPLTIEQNGIIQLIHFSAKEYLTGPSLGEARDQKLRAFHVDPSQTNFHLFRICLQYVQAPRTLKAFPPTGPDPAQRLTKTARVVKVANQLPFLEYATLNWIPHLLACRKTASTRFPTILPSFMTSSNTLVWIETYLTFNHRNSDVLQLDRIVDDMSRWLTDEADEQVVELIWIWKTSLDSLLHEFGRPLIEEPNQVRHIDLALLTGYDKSKLCWQPSSGLDYDRHVILESALPSITSQDLPVSKIGREQMLYRTPGSQVTRLGLFHFHCQSRTFLFADACVGPGSSAWLFCQDSASGRILPALSSLEASPRGLRLLVSRVRADGKYLFLAYKDRNFRARERICLTIWRIPSIDFELNKNDCSWAKKVYSGRRTSYRDWRGSGNFPVISFSDNDKVYFGFECVDLVTGECTLTKKHSHYPSSFSFSKKYNRNEGTCRIIGSENSIIQSYWESLKDDSESRQEWGIDKKIQAASENGEFIVYSYRSPSSNNALALKRAISGETLELSERFEYTEQHSPDLIFLKDNTGLISIIATPEIHIEVHTWDFHSNSVPTVSSRSMTVPLPYHRLDGFCFNEVESELYLATSRCWFRLDLCSMSQKDNLLVHIRDGFQKSGGGSERHATVCISSDGLRAALIDRNLQDVTIKMYDVSKAELESVFQSRPVVSLTDSRDVDGCIYASPDLEVFWIGKSLVHLEVRRDERHVVDFTLPTDFPRDVIDNSSDCLFSSACRKYLAVYAEQWFDEVNKTLGCLEDHVRVFLLDPIKNSVKRLSLQTPSMTSGSEPRIRFHPSEAKLAVLTCITDGAKVIANLYMIDMTTLEVSQLWTCPGEGISYYDTWLYFSDCGTYIQSKSPNGLGARPVYQHQTEKAVTGLQYGGWQTGRSGPFGGLLTSVRVINRLYSLPNSHSFCCDYQLSLYQQTSEQQIFLKIQRRIDEDFTFYNEIHQYALYPLTVMPARLKERSELRLLLGETDHSNLRIVFSNIREQPWKIFEAPKAYEFPFLEIKFLHFSWHDVISDLDAYFADVDIGDTENPKLTGLIPRIHAKR